MAPSYCSVFGFTNNSKKNPHMSFFTLPKNDESLAFVHLVVTAIVTLTIDLTKDEDPMVRAYYHVRWKLITCVFNMISLAYLPLCLYCDWQDKIGNASQTVSRLRIILDVTMTSILMPVTAFADLMFWIFFKTDPSIIAPPHVFEYLPGWTQHSLHTISMVTVIMDLLLTPRQRPSSMKPRLAVLAGFATAYSIMVYIYLQRGEPVYLFLKDTGTAVQLAVYIFFCVGLTLFFFGQWSVIDFVWKDRIKSSKVSKNIK